MTPQHSLARSLLVLVCAWAFLAPAQELQAEYKLGAGDSIRIVVFQNPDLALDTRVTENGTITFPLVGTVRIGGLAIPEAEQAIAKALRDGGHIALPQVNIQLLANRGNQVSVLGAVNRAGRFPLETVNTRVAEIIAIAGGISAGGADVAVVTGTRGGVPFRTVIDVAALLMSGRPENNLVVAGGDIVYVHRMPVFYIYGEVQRSGSYRVERGMTFRQALAQGGGPTLRGTERGLRLYRRGADGNVADATQPSLDEPVQADDVLYVGESLF